MTVGKRVILLVEDEQSISRPLASALQREGFDTVIAASVAEARERLPPGAPAHAPPLPRAPPRARAPELGWFDASCAAAGAEAPERRAEASPYLVLLDLMLPDGSGFDVLRHLRSAGDVPVVVLTARGEEADRIVGLELGADDYVVKPFSAREVAGLLSGSCRLSGHCDFRVRLNSAACPTARVGRECL